MLGDKEMDRMCLGRVAGWPGRHDSEERQTVTSALISWGFTLRARGPSHLGVSYRKWGRTLHT